jgi:spoIIIJ-associated protein
MEDIKKKDVGFDFEGKTIEEAVQKAVDQLKTSKTNLRIKVVSEEQKGLFGMRGAKPARIRVSMLEPKAKKKT